MGRPCNEESSVYMVYILWGRPCMKSSLYIWCTYYGETLYEESSVYMVYILWGDLV